MAVESTTTISGLNSAWPLGSDPKAEGDNHLRLIKSTLKAVFDDSGTTLKTTKPIDSPAGALVGGKPVVTARSRNRVNNPTAQISQENGTTGLNTSGAYPADQWAFFFNGIVSIGQKVTSPVTPEGTTTAVAIWASTAKPSLAAGDYNMVILPVEGLDVADLGWGAAGAKQVILRFAAYAQTPGTYGFAIRNSGTTRSYCGSFTLTTANVVQVFSFPIPGDVTGTWLKDTGIGLTIVFSFAAGSTYVGAAGWSAGSFIAPPGCINGAAVASAGLGITDVGIYADPDGTGLPPPFIAPPYEDDLARCMRYWENGVSRWDGYVTNGTNFSTAVYFKTTKRITPSVSPASGGGTVGFGASSAIAATSSGGVWIYRQGTVTGTGSFNDNWTANARLI